LSEHRDGEGILSLREVRHRPGPGIPGVDWLVAAVLIAEIGVV
jgi:hypothetical protein